MKKLSVLMMIAFSMVFLSACTSPKSTTNTQAQQENTKYSIKEEIAKRNTWVKQDEDKKAQPKEEKEIKKEVKKEEQKEWDFVKDLAMCLKEKKFTMHGTSRCGHCADQKKLFGEEFKNVPFVDCDKDKEICVKAGITGYPTWVDATGKLFPGKMSLERLATISWCEK